MEMLQMHASNTIEANVLSTNEPQSCYIIRTISNDLAAIKWRS